MEPVRFGMIGGGWRAEFFLRICEALPERFVCDGALVRDPAKAAAFQQRWGVPTHGTLDELLRSSRGRFMVVSVPRKVAPEYLRELSGRGMPALCETPPAADLPGMVALWHDVHAGPPIQIAEQLHLQPLHAARIALARSGKLGRVSQAQVSYCHGYHGVNLLRQFLGVQYEDCTITAKHFTSPIVEGPGRGGPPPEERLIDNLQELAWLDFGDRLAVFDFTGEQYFSYIRSQRTLVRGDRGEINQDELRYLLDHQSYVHTTLRREVAGETGNLEGLYLKGYLAGDEWVYTNPMAPGRLSDDEIAVAACLQLMAEHIDGGPGFCSLAEGSQDNYLALQIAQAAKTGQPVTTTRQPWAA